MFPHLMVLAMALFNDAVVDAVTLPPLSSNYSIFQQLVSFSGLNTQLQQSSENLTVFAPTNAAFNQLPSGILNALKQPLLAPVTLSILQYHISPQIFLTTNLTVNQTVMLPTLFDGVQLTAQQVSSNMTMINDALIVDPNIVSNSSSNTLTVVQGIDTVLSPLWQFTGISLSNLQSITLPSIMSLPYNVAQMMVLQQMVTIVPIPVAILPGPQTAPPSDCDMPYEPYC